MKLDDQAASLTCIDCGVYVEETTGGIAICVACFAARGSCCAEFGSFAPAADEARHGDASPPRSAHLCDDDKTSIQHDENTRRFFTASGAVLEYRMAPHGGIEITHTFVPENLRGRGLAADLMEAAMEHSRKNKLMISASCSYAQIYLEKKRF